MNRTDVDLTQLLDTLPISAWGIADVRGLHPLADQYPTAISMLVAFTIEPSDNTEQAYQSMLIETRVIAKQAMRTVITALEHVQAGYYAVGTVGQNEETLTGDFPLKTAATRAGLGWIGKNGLLVTENFGPRVRLEAILTDLDLPTNQPIAQSHCGNCTICVGSCPISCLTGTQWEPGMHRDKLINSQACAHYRKGFIPTLGRRLACGSCALTCPKGQQD